MSNKNNKNKKNFESKNEVETKTENVEKNENVEKVENVEETKESKKEEKKPCCDDKKCCEGSSFSSFILPVIVILVLVVVLAVVFLNKGKFKKGGDDNGVVAESVKKEIQDKLKDPFEKKLLSGAKFEYKEISEKSGLYKLVIKIEEEELTVYLTKDYTMLIPDPSYGLPAIDLEKINKELEDDKKLDVKKTLGFDENSKPRLDYFVMSFCPFGNPADDNAGEIFKTFGDSVDIVPHYIFSLDSESPTGYNSLHGVQEANQDVRELCVLKNLGKAKFFEFVSASNKDLTAEDADTKWKQVAQKVGVDAVAIENCWKNEGMDIVKKEIEVTTALKVTGSPTVFVNGEKSTNKASTIQEGLCKAFPENAKPTACGQNVQDAKTNTNASCN